MEDFADGDFSCVCFNFDFLRTEADSSLSESTVEIFGGVDLNSRTRLCDVCVCAYMQLCMQKCVYAI